MTLGHLGYSMFPTFNTAAMVVGATAAHLYSGKPRIQLVTGYASSAVALAFLAVEQEVVDAWHGFIQTTLSIFLVLGFLIGWVVPVIRLPPPRGRCAVACRVVQCAVPVEVGIVSSAGGGALLHVFYAAGRPQRRTKAEIKRTRDFDGKSTKEVIPGNARAVDYFVHGERTVRGLAKFLNMPRMLFAHLTLTEHSTLDAGAEDVVAEGMTCEPLVLARKTDDGNAVFETAKMPVVLFSPGLGGCPELYRTFAQDIASEGYIVVAVEHNDGSLCYSRPADGISAGSLYQRPTVQELRNGDKLFQLRNGQLLRRVSELRAAYNLLNRVSRGQSTGSNLEFLQGSLDMDHVAVAGHSFGGATALQFASENPKLVRCVIALDPWTEPLSPSTLKRGLPRTPVLSISGDKFSRWEENSKPLRALLCPPTFAEVAGEAEVPTAPSSTPSGDETGGAATSRDDSGPGIDASSADGAGDASRSAHVKSLRVAARNLARSRGVVLPGGWNGGNVVLRLAKTEHQNFCDSAFIAPLFMRRQRQIGHMDPRAALHRINTYACHMLFRYLKMGGADPSVVGQEQPDAAEQMRLSDPHPEAHPPEVRLWTFTGEHAPPSASE